MKTRTSRTLLALTSWLLSWSTTAQTVDITLSDAALERTKHSVTYDGRYLKIPYPNGDVPADMGVCTDVVIRAYRRLGIDLQTLVHNDLRSNIHAYPIARIWGQTKPDTNIDHRRVPNLQTFFERHGESLSISSQPQKYKAGDIVTWILPGNLPHIGIVSSIISQDSERPLIVHNIGRGPKAEDMLFDYKITGHYRFDPGQE